MAVRMTKLGSILILNEEVSGMNRFLFREMEKEWELAVEDVPYPKLYWYYAAARTFHPSKPVWRERLKQRMRRYHISPGCFQWRSRTAQRIAARPGRGKDILFQIGGLFNGVSGNRGRPSVAFASFNTLLAYKEWRPWAPFETEQEFQELFAIERTFYSELDHIVCTNRHVMESFVRDYGVPEQRLHYIGYGVNFDRFDALAGSAKSFRNKLALFVGYDFERKGGPTIVEAFRAVRSRVPDARLRIVGPADMEERFLGDGIEWIPRLSDRNQVLQHFLEADFFVMPSVCEPFGLVFLEAMACRNACIGAFQDAMPEIIRDGETGFLIEVGNAGQLAEYMGRLYTDPSQARSMGNAAYDRVHQQFTWDVAGGLVRTAFRKIAGKET